MPEHGSYLPGVSAPVTSNSKGPLFPWPENPERHTYTSREKDTHTHKLWPLEAPHQGPALFKQHPPAQPPAMKGIKQGVCMCVLICVCTLQKMSMLMTPLIQYWVITLKKILLRCPDLICFQNKSAFKNLWNEMTSTLLFYFICYFIIIFNILAISEINPVTNETCRKK